MSINKRHIQLLVFLIVCICLTGCTEENTTNANESYKFWAGKEPDKNIRALHGQYWQSAHFTREYIAYLELQTPPNWIKAFNAQNHLMIADSVAYLPTDAPAWFKPQKNFTKFKQVNNETLACFEDTTAGYIFIYDQQL